MSENKAAPKTIDNESEEDLVDHSNPVEGLEIDAVAKHNEHHEPDKFFLGTLALFQLISFIFFATSASYADASVADGAGTVSKYYAMFQDVNCMIFVGFGFLMTFLRKHMFNSLGMTFLIGVMAIQLGTLWNTVIHDLFQGHFPAHVDLTITHMITGNFAAGAVLISYGAVLGRVTPTQILWMLFFELIFYAINEYIGAVLFEAVDMGGSMFVHTFGAYFGLAFSYYIGVPRNTEEEVSVYHSDVFAMVGTLFLWMFWPSFNGALAGEALHQQERVVINTVLALCASCAWSFFFSHLYCGKFDMVHVQNATLAGGVAVGSSSDLVIGPWSALLIGLVAGFVSTTGYVYLTPKMNKVIYDVCGVHNLHGMPGVIGGVAGAISAAAASTSSYGENISEIFAARATRTASEQGAFQAATLAVTLLMSIGGGLITGAIVKHLIPAHPKQHFYSDKDEWEVPLVEFGDGYFNDDDKTAFLEKENKI